MKKITISLLFVLVFFFGASALYVETQLPNHEFFKQVSYESPLLDLKRSDLNGMSLKEVFEDLTIPALSNLVTNGDFSAGNTGWGTFSVTGFAVNSGIAEATATAQFGRISQTKSFTTNDVILSISRFKSDTANVIRFVNPPTNTSPYHTGSNQFEIIKYSFIWNNANQIVGIFDYRTSAWTKFYVDYMMLFNLTASHGVTSTSGTAYDNAVADIEYFLSLNNGYISGSIFNYRLWGRSEGLTNEQIETYYEKYQTLKAQNEGLLIWIYDTDYQKNVAIGSAGLNYIRTVLTGIKEFTSFMKELASSEGAIGGVFRGAGDFVKDAINYIKGWF